MSRRRPPRSSPLPWPHLHIQKHFTWSISVSSANPFRFYLILKNRKRTCFLQRICFDVFVSDCKLMQFPSQKEKKKGDVDGSSRAIWWYKAAYATLIFLQDVIFNFGLLIPFYLLFSRVLLVGSKLVSLSLEKEILIWITLYYSNMLFQMTSWTSLRMSWTYWQQTTYRWNHLLYTN